MSTYEEERELRAMQLAAISTASIQNTPTTVQARIDRGNPYCTQAYLDVCAAIDREMALRAALRAIKKECLTMRDPMLGLPRIIRICIDAGITDKLDVL